MSIKSIAKMWYFPSSSGSKTYETLQYDDGSTSCNCMGWCRRVAEDGSRSCKHTRQVDADMAGVPAVDYSIGYTKSAPVQTTAPKKLAVKKQPAPEPESDKKIPTVRHIQWD